MNDEHQILRNDLIIIEEMFGEMETYLLSDTIRWPRVKQDRPELSLGGYLMRQHRLLALRDRLTPEDQSRVDAAIKQFTLTLVERVIRFVVVS